MGHDLEFLKKQIRQGGSVSHKGQIITRIKDLPGAAELATPAGKAALAARDDAKVASPVGTKKVKADLAPEVEDEEEDDD